MMASFDVKENFQFGGGLRRVDTILTISDMQVIAEVKKGKHEEAPNKGKWLSGLLNHCEPADTHTADLIAGKVKPRKEMTDEAAKLADEKELEIKRLRKEFDDLGIAYNPKWAIDKLQKELKGAKKIAGEQKDNPKKTEKV
jgi:hypothetical protein